MDRSFIYTAQEHKLFGSTLDEPKYLERPYTPLGIIDDLITHGEATKLRRGLGTANMYGRYFGINGTVSVTLERLNKQSNTFRDPVALDDRLRRMKTNNSEDFPFRRRSVRIEEHQLIVDCCPRKNLKQPFLDFEFPTLYNPQLIKGNKAEYTLYLHVGILWGEVASRGLDHLRISCQECHQHYSISLKSLRKAAERFNKEQKT